MFVMDGLAFASEPKASMKVLDAKAVNGLSRLVIFSTGGKRLFDASELTDKPAFKLSLIHIFHTVGCSTITYREGGDHDSFPGMMDEWIEPQMESFVDAGYIVKADTLEELAGKLGFEGDTKKNFLATCERQNELFDAQEDPDFGKDEMCIRDRDMRPKGHISCHTRET